MKWEDYKREFVDDGQLRDLYVNNASPHDWQSMLNFLRSTQASIHFYIDGRAANLPTRISPMLADKSHQYHLSVQMGGVNIDCHFDSPEQIQLTFDPHDIKNEFNASLIFRLMQSIGRTLDKPVFCAPLHAEDKPIFQYRPGETVEYLESY
jgi:hypothetical protein